MFQVLSGSQAWNQHESRRNLSIHEADAMGVLLKHDVAVPHFRVAETGDQAHDAAQELGNQLLMMNCQLVFFIHLKLELLMQFPALNVKHS